MPPQPLKKCRPLGTSAVLVETSIGAFVVDLYGLDCPVATAEFINMCRCKYFNGCIATEVVPDNIIVFSHPVEEMRSLTFHSLLEKANTQKQGSEKEAFTHANQLMHLEWERMKRYVAHLQRGGGRTAVHFLHVPATETAGAINRRGLLLAEVPSRANPSSSGDVRRGCSLVLTLGNRHLDYFEDRFMVLGEVREGLGVIEKLRAAPYQHPSSSSLIGTRPTRLVRIKHATVLPTAGTEVFPDVWSNAEGINISSNNSDSRSNSSQERKRLGSILTTIGCFRHWAVREKVQTANRMIIGILKDTFAAVETEEGAKHSEGIRFFLISEKSTKEPSKQSNNDDTDEVQSVEYNPHYHGDYLSSDDEAPQTKSRKERENRHQAVMRLHQDKLNETRALMLNLLDGVADVTGELKPPDNVLFVCKLNPLTTSEGLKMCFSQYGRVVSAEVIRDRRTDNSLCYGFVEFEDVEECYRAFQKMDRALVDDHRIHVDFSQSVSKLWAQRQRDMRKRARVEG